MPDQTTSNELVTELARHLIYSSPNSDLWKEMLAEKNPKGIESRMADITYVGVNAGISEALAHLVMLVYAESEGATLKPENIAAIVRKGYACLETMTDQEKIYRGIPGVKKKAVS